MNFDDNGSGTGCVRHLAETAFHSARPLVAEESYPMTTLKTCSKCHIEYPATSEFFYKAEHHKDGLRSWCNACICEATSRCSKAHPEYSARWRAKHPKAHARWRKDHPENIRKHNIRYKTMCPEAVKAQTAANHAINSGRLKCPQSCELCGAKGWLHKHHPDYSRPLDVIVLCPKCHSWLHKNKEKVHDK